MITCTLIATNNTPTIVPINSLTLRLTRAGVGIDFAAPGYTPTPAKTARLTLHADGLPLVTEATVSGWRFGPGMVALMASGDYAISHPAAAHAAFVIAQLPNSTRVPIALDILPGDTLNGRPVEHITHYVGEHQSFSEVFHYG